MWGDELLPETVASDQGCVVAIGKDQAIVGSQQELAIDTAQGAEATDQGMFQGAGSRGRLAGARQVPAQKLARAAIDDQGQ